jgi:hypothetical protein
MIFLLTLKTIKGMENGPTRRHNEIWDYRSTLGFDTWLASLVAVCKHQAPGYDDTLFDQDIFGAWVRG